MSRKYRQRGYQEDERPEPRQGPSARPDRPDGPRGRGLGKPTATVFRCARCGSKQSLSEEIPEGASCSSCGGDLHTCTNCRHFDTGAPNECRAAIEVAIPKKSTANDCRLFEPKQAQEAEADSGKPDDPRSEFDALFDF